MAAAVQVEMKRPAVEEKLPDYDEDLKRDIEVCRALELIEHQRKPGDSCKQVLVYFCLNEIESVNTKEQTANIDFHLTTYWREPTLIGKLYDDFDADALQKPSIEVAGAKGLVPEGATSIWVNLNMTAYGIVGLTQRYRGTISMKQDLHRFPFDVQCLRISMRSDSWSIGDMRLTNATSEESLAQMTKAINLVEWEVLGPLQASEGTYVSKHNLYTFSTVDITLFLRRRVTYYATKIISILVMLVLMGPLCFLLEPDALSERSSVTFTLFLAAVAFHFVLGEAIPPVSYTTSLDKFILTTYAFLFSTAVEAVVVFVVQRDYGLDTARVIDTIAAITVCCSSWCCRCSSGSVCDGAQRRRSIASALHDSKSMPIPSLIDRIDERGSRASGVTLKASRKCRRRRKHLGRSCKRTLVGRLRSPSFLDLVYAVVTQYTLNKMEAKERSAQQPEQASAAKKKRKPNNKKKRKQHATPLSLARVGAGPKRQKLFVKAAGDDGEGKQQRHSDFIGQFHTLQKRRQAVLKDSRLNEAQRKAAVSEIEAQMEAMGGIDAYQRASIVGHSQSKHKQFNGALWVVRLLQAVKRRIAEHSAAGAGGAAARASDIDDVDDDDGDEKAERESDGDSEGDLNDSAADPDVEPSTAATAASAAASSASAADMIDDSTDNAAIAQDESDSPSHSASASSTASGASKNKRSKASKRREEEDSIALTDLHSYSAAWLRSSPQQPQAAACKLLDVGSLCNHFLPYRSWIDCTAIDLNPQHESVQKMDFFDVPYQQARYDVVVLSLVINFVGDRAMRGQMLVRAHRLLLPRGFLFLVIPRACVHNSRYMTHERLVECVVGIGFKVLLHKFSNKLAFYMLEKAHREGPAKPFKPSGPPLPGAKRNNFSVVVESDAERSGAKADSARQPKAQQRHQHQQQQHRPPTQRPELKVKRKSTSGSSQR